MKITTNPFHILHSFKFGDNFFLAQWAHSFLLRSIRCHSLIYPLPGESSLLHKIFTTKNSFSYLEWYGHKNYLKNTLHTNYKKKIVCTMWILCQKCCFMKCWYKISIERFLTVFTNEVIRQNFFMKKKTISFHLESNHNPFLNDCFVWRTAPL